MVLTRNQRKQLNNEHTEPPSFQTEALEGSAMPELTFNFDLTESAAIITQTNVTTLGMNSSDNSTNSNVSRTIFDRQYTGWGHFRCTCGDDKDSFPRFVDCSARGCDAWGHPNCWGVGGTQDITEADVIFCPVHQQNRCFGKLRNPCAVPTAINVNAIPPVRPQSWADTRAANIETRSNEISETLYVTNQPPNLQSTIKTEDGLTDVFTKAPDLEWTVSVSTVQERMFDVERAREMCGPGGKVGKGKGKDLFVKEQLADGRIVVSGPLRFVEEWIDQWEQEGFSFEFAPKINGNKRLSRGFKKQNESDVDGMIVEVDCRRSECSNKAWIWFSSSTILSSNTSNQMTMRFRTLTQCRHVHGQQICYVMKNSGVDHPMNLNSHSSVKLIQHQLSKLPQGMVDSGNCYNVPNNLMADKRRSRFKKQTRNVSERSKQLEQIDACRGEKFSQVVTKKFGDLSNMEKFVEKRRFLHAWEEIRILSEFPFRLIISNNRVIDFVRRLVDKVLYLDWTGGMIQPNLQRDQLTRYHFENVPTIVEKMYHLVASIDSAARDGRMGGGLQRVCELIAESPVKENVFELLVFINTKLRRMCGKNLSDIVDFIATDFDQGIIVSCIEFVFGVFETPRKYLERRWNLARCGFFNRDATRLLNFICNGHFMHCEKRRLDRLMEKLKSLPKRTRSNLYFTVFRLIQNVLNKVEGDAVEVMHDVVELELLGYSLEVLVSTPVFDLRDLGCIESPSIVGQETGYYHGVKDVDPLFVFLEASDESETVADGVGTDDQLADLEHSELLVTCAHCSCICVVDSSLLHSDQLGTVVTFQCQECLGVFTHYVSSKKLMGCVPLVKRIGENDRERVGGINIGCIEDKVFVTFSPVIGACLETTFQSEFVVDNPFYAPIVAEEIGAVWPWLICVCAHLQPFQVHKRTTGDCEREIRMRKERNGKGKIKETVPIHVVDSYEYMEESVARVQVNSQFPKTQRLRKRTLQIEAKETEDESSCETSWRKTFGDDQLKALILDAKTMFGWTADQLAKHLTVDVPFDVSVVWLSRVMNGNANQVNRYERAWVTRVLQKMLRL